MRMLITTDGSEHAVTAINAASRLLRKTDLELNILHVVTELSIAVSGAESFTTLAKLSIAVVSF
jgi:hypothetical protein